MTLTIEYKEYVGRSRPDYDIDWCCEKARNSSLVSPVLIDHGDVPRIGVQSNTRMTGMTQEAFSFCPFCGDEISLDRLGKFERKTVEERVE
jgi:hypothetical protein